MKLLRNIAAGITLLTVASFAVAQTTYKIESVNSGKVVNVEGYSTDDGATINQWTYNGTTNQQWTLEDAGNGAYLIRNVGSGKVLDIVDSSTEIGAYITQMGNNGGASQQWYIDDLGGGTKIITNVNSGMLLDVEGISLDDGALIHQWDNWGGANQQWLLVAVGTVQPPGPPTCGSISKSAETVYGNSFEVYANNVQNVARVVFSTWTDANGQDDLVLHEGVYDAANNRWKCTINLGEHNCEGGNYTTHVNLIGLDGSSVFAGGMSTNVEIQVSAMRDQAILPVGATYAPITYTNSVPLYRLNGSWDHFYTANYSEVIYAAQNGYTLEGIVGYVHTSQVYGTVPLYRYYFGGKHFYTTNYNELGSWNYEGIACYVYTAGSSPNLSPLYRYFDHEHGGHFYTTNPAEEINGSTPVYAWVSTYHYNPETGKWVWAPSYELVGYENILQYEGVQCYLLK